MKKIFGFVGLFVVTVLVVYVSSISVEDKFVFDAMMLFYSIGASVIAWFLFFIICITRIFLLTLY